MKTFITLILTCVSTLSIADRAKHPYGCSEIKSSEGYRSIVPYDRTCSRRQAPEALAKCIREVEDKESDFFKSYESNFEKGCSNKNGYTKSETCVYRNTWEVSGQYSFWYYQTVKANFCIYR